MKILKIRLKNLNSLYGEWNIVFTAEEFQQNGIFAITGPTGAGKTTILDAITLALYGKTARLKDVNKSTNEIMSRGAGECLAEVEFSQKNKFYKVFWEQTRARKKPDGGLQESRQELAERTQAGWKIVAALKSKVQAEIEKICGMNFERFLRSMLLAQGRFSEFLFADANERSPILEQITGTQIYSDISVAVFEREKDEAAKLELQTQVFANIKILSDEELALAEKTLSELLAEFAQKSSQKKLFEAELSKIRERKNLENRLEICEKDFLVLKQKEEDFQPEKLKILRAQSAQTLLPDWSKTEELNAEIENERTHFKHLQALFSDCQKAIQAAEKSENSGAEILKNSSLHYENSMQKINSAKIIDAEIAVEKNNLAQALTNLQKEKSAMEAKLKELRILEKTLSEKEEEKLEAKKVYSDFSAEKILSDFRKMLSDAIQAESTAAKSESFQQHRKNLSEGSPCPLCGSISHPYSKNPPSLQEKTSRRNEIAESLSEAEKLSSQFANLSVGSDEKTESQHSKVLPIAPILTHQDLLKDVQKKCSQLNSLSEKISSLDSIISVLRAEIEQKRSSHLADESRIKDIQSEIDSRKISISARESSRNLICDAPDLEVYKNSLASSLRRAQENLDAAKALLSSKKLESAGLAASIKSSSDLIESNLKKRASLSENFSAKLLSAGFVDIADFLSAKMSPQDLSALKIRQDAIVSGLSVKSDLKKQLENILSEKDFSSQFTLEELSKKIFDYDAEIAELLQKSNLQKQILLDDKNAKNTFASQSIALEQAKRKAGKWRKLREMIGSRDGGKFRTFAQGITFDLMIHHANNKLALMSDRYLLVQTGDNLSLGVVDNYQGGEIRSIKNLSGGESFIVSLALALGFSDMSAQNLSVESLFLDEGFGSLDEKALRTALDTLSMLNENGKQIGVISHVEALKESIPLQIIVEPYSPGRSRISGAGCSQVQ